MLGVLTLVVIGVLVVAWSLQRRLIYLPAGAPPPVEQTLPGGEAVTLHTADGLDLDAWFVPAGPTAVAVFPGNAGNRAARAPLARALAAEGLSVLLVDYRGYGGNPGSPSEEGLRADARAAADWLAAHPELERVVYLGESLGGGVATGLATERPPSALVLRSPFSSLGAVARQHYAFVPDWLLRDRFPVREQIGEVEVPTLVVAGEADGIVPAELSREVHAAAAGPKRLVTVPEAGHNDRALLDGARFIGAVVDFLREHGALAAE